jgi:cysteine desulfurase
MSIYMDHAATTPVSESVRKAMEPYFSEKFGNPSSIYALGREAKAALWDAREKAAELLGAESPSEIIFTSGATESNNLAVKGVAHAGAFAIGGVPHVITTSIEHHCVLDSVKFLGKNYGVEVTFLPVNKEGLVDPKEVEKALKPNTVMVSVMMGNNEVGTVEPIAEIGALLKKVKDKRHEANDKTPLVFHTDAVQAFQYFDCDVDKLGVDMLSLTGHKFYGPKGVGLLYVRKGARFIPQQDGGAQERNLRAGTENVPYIIGMVQAMEDAAVSRKESDKHISELSDYLTARILKEIPETELLGPKNVSKRLPHISSILFKRVEGESILINLDLQGIAASSGSACTSGSLEASHVTKAMGYSDLEAHGAVRFSLGKVNKKEDIDKLMEILPGVIEKLRAMSPIK